MSDSESNKSDEEIDEAEHARQMAKIANRGQRKGCSAEKQAKPESGWKPPVYEKSVADREQIKSAISKSFLFRSLNDQSLNTVIDAFLGPTTLTKGQKVIEQGEEVVAKEPALYVLQNGELDVFKRKADETGYGQKVFTYDKTGQAFGELALLYSCPRAATVIASAPSVVWSMDRDTFNHCVKNAAMEQCARYQEFVEGVEIFSSLTKLERERLVDVLQPRTYSKGDKIIQRGDEGNEMFIIEEGTAYAEKDGHRVKEYDKGDYFGELALRQKEARAADIYADSPVTKVVTLDADCFTRLLGNLEAMMAQRAKEYEKINATL